MRARPFSNRKIREATHRDASRRLQAVHVLQRGAAAEVERLQAGEALEAVHVFVLTSPSMQNRWAEMVEHFAVAAKVGDFSHSKHAGVPAPCFLFERIVPVLPDEAEGVFALPLEPRFLRFADGVVVGVALPHLPADAAEEDDDEHAPKLFIKAALAFRGVPVFHTRLVPHAASNDKAREIRRVLYFSN